MRPKMRRASSMALLITDRPGAVKINAAAPRAASVAPDTAVPQSACFKAGASLTPSPVIATRWPRACSALTMAYLCSGKTRAKPSARSIVSAISGGTLLGSMSLGKASAAGMMWVPMPSWRAVSIAIAVSSPVTILTGTPFSFALSIVALESSRGGSNIGSTPSNDQVCPSVFGSSDAERARTLGRQVVDSFLDPLRNLRRRLGEVDDDLGRTLGHDHGFSLGIGDRRLGTFAHRIERHEFHLL